MSALCFDFFFLFVMSEPNLVCVHRVHSALPVLWRAVGEWPLGVSVCSNKILVCVGAVSTGLLCA